MSVIYILLPVALLLAVVALGGFLWAVRHGQLDDLDTPPVRMLFDEDEPDQVSGGPDADAGAKEGP